MMNTRIGPINLLAIQVYTLHNHIQMHTAAASRSGVYDPRSTATDTGQT